MTLPSTEELQRLLDEATPGPWYLHEDETGDPDGTYLHDEKGVMCIAITPIGSGSDYRKDDLDLAALAPVLAAEVIRLQKENERLTRIEWLAEQAAESDSGLAYDLDQINREYEGDQA